MSRALSRDQRVANDAYYTPDDVARACLATMDGGSPRMLIEPSVGGGAFARAARVQWPITPRIVGFDIDHAASGRADCDDMCVIDWSTWARVYGPLISLPNPTWVIGNPPYSKAQAHIEAALGLGVERVGMLLRLAFMEGQKRVPFWRAHQPYSVSVLSKRPSFTGGGTDSAAYAFFEWRRGFSGETTMQWVWP